MRAYGSADFGSITFEGMKIIVRKLGIVGSIR